MVLKSRPHPEANSMELEHILDKTTKITPIYEVDKIHDRRITNGDIEIDKKGIRSANFPNFSLNENDQLDVRIRRNKEAYTITANGKYFDQNSPCLWHAASSCVSDHQKDCQLSQIGLFPYFAR